MNNIHLNIVYQAKVNLNNEKIYGYEVLARFFDGDKQLNTEHVINKLSSIKEKRNLTSRVISILLDEISILSKYDYTYSVNISSSEIEDMYFKNWIDTIITKYGNISNLVEFEITEKDCICNMDRFIENLKYLKYLNFSIALDDVGVGYNTLSLIDNLYPYINLDYIKLDRQIVNTIHDFSIVECILNIAHSKGIKVIAEGIEDLDTYNKLKELDCDFGQGYFIHKPSALKFIY